ncbi:MAG: ABC transporter permease [Anaerolineae bacterium]|nr:ABC transporter permease [Gemmatimonadaceae bacterium]
MTHIPGLRRYFRLPRLSGGRVKEDVDSELQFHLEMRTRELAASGMTPEAARKEALRQFGDLDYTKRYCRDLDERQDAHERREAWLDALRQDTRYAWRQLGRSPGFTTVAVLTLALGIGANTAIFTAVDGVLLRPLPYAEADRLVALWQHNRAEGGKRDDVSPANFLDWRSRSRTFENIAAAEPFGFDYMGPEGPETFRVWLVSDGFFRIMRTPALVGRTFADEEYTAGREQVVVLGYGLWQRRFGGDSSVVGRTLVLDGQPRTVVGVMPPEFNFPTDFAEPKEMWAPRVFNERERQIRGGAYLTVAGRLGPGSTLEHARTEMSSIASELSAEYPATNTDIGALVVPLHEQMVGHVRPALLVLLGAVAFVLLIACANVANLLLARASHREQEFAVRAALGAGRGRVVRQLITESLILALLGAAAGVLLAHWGVQGIRALSPPNLPRVDELAIDGRVLGFALGISFLTALLFGMAPALRAARPDLHEGLKAGGRSATGSGRKRLRNLIVISEVALATVLLVGAGLLVRSFESLLRVDRGYRSENVLAINVFTWDRYSTPELRTAFMEESLDRIAALPGVLSAGAASALPLADPYGAEDADVTIEGQAAPPRGQEPSVQLTVVTSEYFKVLDIALKRGRLLTRTDDSRAAPVALINETMARRFWPAEDAVGRKFTVRFMGRPVTREVIGVVADVRRVGLDEPPRPSVYVPHPQSPTGSMAFVVRTNSDPLAMLPAVKESIWSLNKTLPIYSTATLEGLLSESLKERRFNLLLLACFAVTALSLAAVGVYGLMSHATNERTQEIGLRLALGARSADILTLVLRHGALLTLSGVAAGVALAAALTRVLSSMLFGVTSSDLPTFLAVIVTVIAVAGVACYLPARRAVRIDPMVALRTE